MGVQSKILDALNVGFRKSYLNHLAIEQQLDRWCEAFPELCRSEVIGQTPEGRELRVLIIDREPGRPRPAAWIDGNMHALELAGSSVALAIAEDVLRAHLDPEAELHGLPAHVIAQICEVPLYVLPRMSPDGAEAVIKTGAYVRSVNRDDRPKTRSARWVQRDLDGNGETFLMRVPDPTGEFAVAPEFPGLLVRRRIEDQGPFYKLYPEGFIEDFDGVHVPTPDFQADNWPDFNRNFPYAWAPEPTQEGAGPFPGSEPETRAVTAFSVRHPELFLWVNYHCFGGVNIRPHGSAPDAKMDQDDLALFRQIEAWSTEHTKYPTVSGFEQFTYLPDTPLHGDLSDWAYHARGCVSWVCELWDLFEQAGLPKRDKFVYRYTQLDRGDVVKLAVWDRDHNHGRVMRGWTPVDHPQLGLVEIGGLDPRVGLWNPPWELLPGVCRDQAALVLRAIAMAPRIELTLTATSVSPGLTRIDAKVDNVGYLPTFVLSSAKALPFNSALQAVLTPKGCDLVDPQDDVREIGHLDGWGRGLWDGLDALYLQRSRGTTGTKRVSWWVRGAGTVEVAVMSPRMGEIRRSVAISG
jgi:hypothetical protein